MADISTLIDDITRLIEQGHESDPANVAELGQLIAQKVADRLTEGQRERKFKLSLSQVGRPDLQLWLDKNHKGNPEKLDAPARMKFLFGDILELVLLFLAKEAGHRVEHQQREVEVDGVLGHIDCTIDDVLVDAKSCSTYAYKKFSDGSLRRKDDFGYLWQLSGYHEAMGQRPGAFFYIDKTLGKFGLLQIPAEELKLYHIRDRIAHIKEVLASPVAPAEKCFDDVPDGKSGNMKLDIGCSYCKHKEECWPGLRLFAYANGPRWLTVVKREPKINKDEEIE